MKKIVLMPIKNEAWILESSFTNISTWADIIIVADQMSTDGSRDICAKFEKVKVIDNPNEGHSNKVRWLLLDEARKYGIGNLIVCIDADEIVVGNDMHDVQKLNTYKAGQTFEMPWVQLWKSIDSYRTDGEWNRLTKLCAFIDDGHMDYNRTPVINDHTARIPLSPFPPVRLDTHLLHLEYVPFKRSQMKQAWYRCAELINGKRSARRINTTYMITLATNNVTTEKVPSEWLHNIIVPAHINDAESQWHRDQIFNWFTIHGITFFEPLDIWHIDELKNEFIQQTGRQPVSRHFPLWLVFLNGIKNKVINSIR